MAISKLTTKQKEQELNGKRYKIINETIKDFNENNSPKMSHEEIIDLHYAWHLTIQSLKGK